MKYIIFTLILVVSNSQNNGTNWDIIKNTFSTNVTMQNYGQLMWSINISIGYPDQYFMVQFDTGSNILWVPFITCKRCQMDVRYNPNDQAGFAPNGGTYFQAYGKGMCSGIMASDTVSLVGSNVNDTFLMMFATFENGFVSSEGFNGIMGFSNNQTYQNIFQMAYESGQIESEVYGVVLNQSPHKSYLLFGTIDPILMNSAIWVIPNDIYRWKLFINSLTINGVDYTQQMGSQNSAILDTGTSELVVSTNLYTVLVQDYLIPAGCNISHSIYCPCRPNATNMPNITVAFNQVNITIPFMNLLQYYYLTSSNDTCLLTLSYISGQPFMIFGDPALLSIIPIFNKTQNLIGIIGGVANDIPNGDYSGDDEIDESYATY